MQQNKYQSSDGRWVKTSIFSLQHYMEDLVNERYGSFIYGRFLNPILPFKNPNLIETMQKDSIKKEVSLQKFDLTDDDKKDKKKCLIEFIYNRGLLFNKYLRTLNSLNIDNEYIYKFFSSVYKEILNKPNLRSGTREADIVRRYWKTRFILKGEPVSINDIIGTNIRLKNNYYIGGEDSAESKTQNLQK